MFLRQSTSQVILFGPCLDKTDGVTEETALTLAQADMRLSKDGGAFAQKSAAGNATHDSDGWYNTTLSTTDTNTVGELILNVHQPANMLPVWCRYWVIEEAVYDAIFGASATGNTAKVDTIASDIVQIYSDTTAIHSQTTVVESDSIIVESSVQVIEAWGDPSSDLAAIESELILVHSETTVIQSDTTAIESSVGPIVSGTADSGSTTTMVDAARTEADADYWKGKTIKFTSGTISGQCRLITGFNATTDTITFYPAATQAVSTNTYEILPQSGVEPIYSDTTIIASDSVAVESSVAVVEGWGLSAVASDAAAVESELILVHSETTVVQSQTTVIESDSIIVESSVQAIEAWGNPSSDLAAIESELILVHSETTVIQSQTTVIESNSIVIESQTTVIESNSIVIESDTTLMSLGIITGLAQTGTLSTTQATTNLSGYADDQLIGRVLVVTSGAADGEATDITDYANTNGLLTFTALTTAMANNDTFKIV